MKVYKIVKKKYVEALEKEIRRVDKELIECEKKNSSYEKKLDKIAHTLDTLITNSKKTKKTVIVAKLTELKLKEF